MQKNSDKKYILECKKCGSSFKSESSLKKICDSCRPKKSVRKPIENKKYSRWFYYRRKEAFARDNFECRGCGMGVKELEEKYPVMASKKRNGSISVLHCHHIDANKRNNSLSNLVTLCPACHAGIHCRYKNWELKGLWITDILPKNGVWQRKKPRDREQEKPKKLFKGI